ncbi:DUF1840 domain-containing protein [Rheinheimera muenzenbergensis]|uniref:DUF1840 domain-containing protein n=1 Tax=Rheinheimera muenzenbergensis TaxID=1193628 RepID=A0ABU8C8J7_9GAMM|nr:DUF1840 domain-containing protein [Gammaproteobacteria bacterium]MBU1554432.1 DUF1840 domain-containing protein [Gammaproteobacteria bacterium]MBU2070218.1 DUF1840 domain-containing protein [Gammaproteobacteria bacterium]MBU2183531.1 DUF1840 domain-containing protein [Gammaproteobacteria bacterium]MBU2206633.1 DUF1840 domain-containing protein [Gammaproteobacteria bacterium]
MIVTFKSKASGDLIYFKDIALKLLQLMGRDDKVPSALYAEDVGSALALLQQGLAAIAATERAKAEQANTDIADQPHAGKERVSLQVRAVPLLEMLQKAQKKHCPVLWQ